MLPLISFFSTKSALLVPQPQFVLYRTSRVLPLLQPLLAVLLLQLPWRRQTPNTVGVGVGKSGLGLRAHSRSVSPERGQANLKRVRGSRRKHRIAPLSTPAPAPAAVSTHQIDSYRPDAIKNHTVAPSSAPASASSRKIDPYRPAPLRLCAARHGPPTSIVSHQARIDTTTPH